MRDRGIYQQEAAHPVRPLSRPCATIIPLRWLLCSVVVAAATDKNDGLCLSVFRMHQ